MPAASLTKVDTTSQSWLVLPKTQGITGYRCVCLSRAAQLQSCGLAVNLVSLSQACCLHRRHSCATSAFCAIEAVHRKVCWQGPPLKHRLALRISVEAGTCCWSDRYLWALLYMRYTFARDPPTSPRTNTASIIAHPPRKASHNATRSLRDQFASLKSICADNGTLAVIYACNMHIAICTSQYARPACCLVLSGLAFLVQDPR